MADSPQPSEWNQSRIQKLIDDKIQESLSLDYKAAGALARTNQKTDDITKDVSAMANSAGGTIIYGVREHTASDKKHLPEAIDPVDLTQFSREWLEQVINNIKPRIEGIVIHPVSIASANNHVVYVVEIPQGATAHQATDNRYYKRFNFQSASMEDYEIRDIIGRQKHPNIELLFGVIKSSRDRTDGLGPQRDYAPFFQLKVVIRNKGDVYAEYVNVILTIPKSLLSSNREGYESVEEEGQECRQIRITNTVREVVGFQYSTANYGPSRFDPILPKLSHIHWISLTSDFGINSVGDLKIYWWIYADNATPRKGSIRVANIPVKNWTS